MKKIIVLLFVSFAIICVGCTETEFEKTVFPYAEIVGEYVLELELTQPFEASDVQHIRIYNVAEGVDSLWIEDEDFFDSKVKVKWDGANTFSVQEGTDVANGEVVNITGEVFPAKDSVHIEWTYLQLTGDPADDFVVVANGVLFNGLDN